MKTIRRFSNVAEAGFAQSVLEAAGIHASLADEHAFTLGPQYAPWGIRLQVFDHDAERALRVLDLHEGFTPLPDDFVPPVEPPDETTPSAPRRSSFTWAFAKGGLWAIGVFALGAMVCMTFGGWAHADLGGLSLLFVLGGIGGVIVRAIDHKGTRDASPSDRNA